MTTLTQPPAQPPPAHDARKRVTQAKVVRSEWTKFRSQPSAAWSLLVVGFPPATLADKVASYLPTPAGVAVTDVRPDPASLGPWTGFGLACLCTAIVPGLAAWRLRRRDV
jgi:hypothetical protein